MKKENKILILITLFFLLLGLLTPLSFGDDLDWKGPEGMARLNNHFRGYNGRYFGNMLIMLITRYTFIRVIIYSFINTAIVYLIAKLSNAKHHSSLIVTLILLFVLPAKVYGQTFGWFAGFANYNTGMFFSLLMIYLVLNNKNIILIILTSFSGQLFIENITLYNLFASTILIFLAKNTKLYKKLIAFVFTALGATVMFSNSVYGSIFNGDDFYRTFDYSGYLDILKTSYINNLIINNWLLLLTLTVLIICLVKKNGKNFNIPVFIMIFVTSISIFFSFNGYKADNFPSPVSLTVFVLAILYLISLAYIVYMLDIFKDNKKEIIFLGFSAGVILAPFLFIQPFGPRAAFSSHIFLTIVAVSLWDKYIEISNLNYEKNVKPYLLVVITTISILLIIIITSNRSVMDSRVDNMIKQDENTYIISDVPFPDYGQHLSPNMSLDISPRTFRELYGFDDNQNFQFVKYSDKKIMDKELMDNK